MALTEIDKKLITKMLADGKTKEEIPGLLAKAKEKMGLSSGTFASRASAQATLAPNVSESTKQKAPELVQATEDLNAAPDKTSVMDVVTGKKNIYGETIPEVPSMTGLAVGAAKGVASAVSGAAELGEKGLQAVTGIKPTYAGGAETAGELVKESEALQAEGTDQKVGKFIGENVLPAILGSGAATGAVKMADVSGKTGTLLNFLASSGGGTAGYTVGGQGELPTVKELGVGMAVDLMTLGLGKLATKIAPQIFRVGANPTGKNYIDIEDKATGAVGNYVGTKKQIVNQADEVISAASTKMDDLLKNSTETFTRSQLAEGALESATALEKGNPMQASQITDYADEWVKGAGKSQELKATDLREVKSQLGEMLSNVFSKDRAGDPKVAAQGQALLGIWGKIDEILDGLSPEVSKLNKEMNIAYSIKKPLELALEKPFLQNFLSMLNPKNIPGTTPITTGVAAGLSKLQGILDQPGVPETIKTAILEAISSLQGDNQ